MRNTAMSETCTAVSRLLQEWVVFNVNSGMIIGVNMPFGMIIGHGRWSGSTDLFLKISSASYMY